jgi:hypothetical protein
MDSNQDLSRDRQANQDGKLKSPPLRNNDRPPTTLDEGPPKHNIDAFAPGPIVGQPPKDKTRVDPAPDAPDAGMAPSGNERDWELL